MVGEVGGGCGGGGRRGGWRGAVGEKAVGEGAVGAGAVGERVGGRGIDVGEGRWANKMAQSFRRVCLSPSKPNLLARFPDRPCLALVRSARFFGSVSPKTERGNARRPICGQVWARERPPAVVNGGMNDAARTPCAGRLVALSVGRGVDGG